MTYKKRVTAPPSFYESHGISTQAPPKNALFWKLWDACSDIAHQALDTDFIQGIKQGNLNPERYGSYTVMDIYYCLKGAEDYKTVAARATDPHLKAMLQHKYESYQSYNQTTLETWGLKNADGISPNEAVLAYSALEHEVATQEDPIYTLVAMLPCEFLWYWLSDQLKDDQEGNLYAFWIKGNLDPSGAYAMGNVIESYRKAHPAMVDEAKALSIYKAAMEGERNDFAARAGG